MQLREALIQQSPSLALQRAAADEIAALDVYVTRLHQAAADYREAVLALMVNPKDCKAREAFLSAEAGLRVVLGVRP